MAKSKSKELERLRNLRRAGDISEREYQKLRNEAINGSQAGKKKKNQSSVGGAILLIIIIIWIFNIITDDGKKKREQ